MILFHTYFSKATCMKHEEFINHNNEINPTFGIFVLDLKLDTISSANDSTYLEDYENQKKNRDYK